MNWKTICSLKDTALYLNSTLQVFTKIASKGASTPGNIASNIAGNSFHINSGVQGGDIAGN